MNGLIDWQLLIGENFETPTSINGTLTLPDFFSVDINRCSISQPSICSPVTVKCILSFSLWYNVRMKKKLNWVKSWPLVFLLAVLVAFMWILVLFLKDKDWVSIFALLVVLETVLLIYSTLALVRIKKENRKIKNENELLHNDAKKYEARLRLRQWAETMLSVCSQDLKLLLKIKTTPVKDWLEMARIINNRVVDRTTGVPVDATANRRRYGNISFLKAVQYLSEFATLMEKMSSGDVEKMEIADQKTR